MRGITGDPEKLCLLSGAVSDFMSNQVYLHVAPAVIAGSMLCISTAAVLFNGMRTVQCWDPFEV